MATAASDTLTSQPEPIESVQRARAALRQILEWLADLAFDTDDLAEIDTAVARRRASLADEVPRPEKRQAAAGVLSPHLGAGWLEWQWIRKESAREYGPYLHCRWREAGRKRTRYVGKVAASE